MTWIKVKTSTGKELSIPESVYKNLYSNSELFTLVQESKSAPINNEKPKEIVKDDVSKYRTNETIGVRKSTKKII